MKTLRMIASAALGLLTLPLAVLVALPFVLLLALWYACLAKMAGRSA